MKIEKMDERQLATVVDFMVENSVTDSGSLLTDNEEYLKRYKAEAYGDEVEGRSRVVSTDTRDLVESDMPSLARVFLGAGDPVEFEPIKETREAYKEAKDKQAIVSYIIKNIPNSFRTQHDWLKASEIQSIAAIEYGCKEVRDTKVKKYTGIDTDELTAIIASIEAETDVDKVDIIESDDEEEGVMDATIRITYERNEYFMNGVPIEDMIISRNATNKKDADIIGKRFKKRRGDLVQEGWSIDEIDKLPSSSDGGDNDRNTLKAVRYNDQGGEDWDSDTYLSWSNQEIEGYDVYALVDYDGDGIAERRHIIQVGNTVLENEPFDHVPYAIISSMLMPYDVIGSPRAELTRQYDRTNTVLWRQMLDNIYAVNNPRMLHSEAVDIDDLLDISLNGLIRTEGSVNDSLMPIQIPYIGDKSLQVVAYMDGKKTASTGATMANQALQADNLHEETATRFKGMEQAAAAKIELVARVIAEVGYRDLWEGIAWFAAHYQDTDLEVRVLGRQMTINPTEWKYDHKVAATVGTGAGDDEQKMGNLSAIYQIQSQLLASGSTLVDQTKLYNTLAEMTKTMGRNAVSQLFNNPEVPEAIVTAERDMLKQMVKQMEAQQQNPLAEAEKVKGEYEMKLTQLRQKQEAELETLKMQQNYSEKLRDAELKFNKEAKDMQFKYDQLLVKSEYDYTALAAKEGNSLAEIQKIQAGLAGKSDQELLAIVAGQ